MKTSFPLLNPAPGEPRDIEIDPAAVHQVSPLGRAACRVLHATDGVDPAWVEVKVGWMNVLGAPTLHRGAR